MFSINTYVIILIIFLVLLIGIIYYYFTSIKTRVMHVLDEIDIELHPSKIKDKPTVYDSINSVKQIIKGSEEYILPELKSSGDPENPTIYDSINSVKQIIKDSEEYILPQVEDFLLRGIALEKAAANPEAGIRKGFFPNAEQIEQQLRNELIQKKKKRRESEMINEYNYNFY